MAQPPTPVKPPVSPPLRPAASPTVHSQSKPPETPQTTEATQMHLNIHGVAPRPNMAPPPLEPDDYGEVVQAELKAGREALATNKTRADAEQEAGKKAIAHLNRHSQSKE